MTRKTPPAVCPNCSEPVPPSALACPECGADWDTGWKDAVDFGGDEGPEDDFDYEESLGKEFGESPKPQDVKPLWWITGIAILVLFLFGALRFAF
jgi:hypothetical protein